MSPTPQILITGGGPVGLFLALRLVRLGLRTTLLEAEPTLSPKPRALGYFGPSQFALQHAGIWEDVRDAGYLLEGLSWRKMTTEKKEWGDLIAEWNIADSGPYERGECGCGMTILGQDRLREIILRKLEGEEGADVRFGYTVVEIEQDENAAKVVAVDGKGERHEFSGTYVVGADGGKSVTRKALGLSLEGHTWPEILVATDTRVRLPLPKDGPPFVYLVDPVDWGLFSPIEEPSSTGPSYYRITVPMSPEDCESEDFERRLHAQLDKVIPGDRPLKYEVVRWQQYRIHQRIVPTMISGRGLLIGDAAHLNNPWGGLGLTTGLLDADSLADVLERVLIQGREQPAELLQKWAEARRHVFSNIVNPVSSDNKLRCHTIDPSNPESDPFFRMLRKEGNEEDLRQLFDGLSGLATDVNQLTGTKN